MPLPYRTVLRLPADIDVVQLAEQEIEGWIAEKKITAKARRELAAGQFFVPGVHQLSGSHTLSVAHADRSEDGSRRRLYRFTEANDAGEWQVDVVALDYSAESRRDDALVILSSRVDAPDATGEVDPPRLVRRILERREILDSSTAVTAEPKLIHVDDVAEVMTAITDPDRSVSVIVAASPGIDVNVQFRERVGQLTRKILGAAGVFVLTPDAQRELAGRLPASHAVPEGRVRTFLPQVDLEDPLDGRRHRVLRPSVFANAIHGGSVSRALQGVFAIETRAPRLSSPLPKDIRRAIESLASGLAEITRAGRIEERARAARSARDVSTATVPSAESWRYRIGTLLRKWLHIDGAVTDSDLDTLDDFIATQTATSETIFEDARKLEQELSAERERAVDLQLELDDLSLDLADAADEAEAARRRIEYLQRQLRDAGRYAEAYAEPDKDAVWGAPDSIVELVERLQPSSSSPHMASSLVIFTGDVAAAEEVQKRDQLGRYCSAMWEYVHVLYDYASLKASGAFSGSVRMYLIDESVLATKCPPQRHAAKESDTVLSNASWRAERILPVPTSIAPTGRTLMEAHFRPTHRDAFAPRMYYYDDTDNSGKIYVGYIGKHLTNTKTKNS